MSNVQQRIATFSLARLEQAVAIGGADAYVIEFVHCLASQGILYLTDAGLGDAMQEPMREEVMNFFTHGTASERASVTGQMRRGLIPLEGESVAMVMNQGTYSDYSMAYSMGAHNNVFPPERPRFARAWQAYYDAVSAAGRRLVNLTLKLFGLPPADTFDNLLRFRYYPDLPARRAAEVQPMRIGQHHDVSYFTLIHQTPCRNGFVSNECHIGGRFVGVPTVPETVIAQVGAVLSILTDGRVRCPLHRVTAAPGSMLAGSSRTASVMFLRPAADWEFNVAIAHRLGFADRIKNDGKPGRFGDWIGINDTRLDGKEQPPVFIRSGL